MGHVQWFNNWVAFIDNVMQVSVLSSDTRSLYVPTSIDKIVINSVKHMENLKTYDVSEPLLPVYVYSSINYCR